MPAPGAEGPNPCRPNLLAKNGEKISGTTSLGGLSITPPRW